MKFSEKRSDKKFRSIMASFSWNHYRSASDTLRVTPFGIRKLLNWIKKSYGNLPIYITENGYASNETLEDTGRISYYENYINNVMRGITALFCRFDPYTFTCILMSSCRPDGFWYFYVIIMTGKWLAPTVECAYWKLEQVLRCHIIYIPRYCLND